MLYRDNFPRGRSAGEPPAKESKGKGPLLPAKPARSGVQLRAISTLARLILEQLCRSCTCQKVRRTTSRLELNEYLLHFIPSPLFVFQHGRHVECCPGWSWPLEHFPTGLGFPWLAPIILPQHRPSSYCYQRSFDPVRYLAGHSQCSAQEEDFTHETTTSVPCRKGAKGRQGCCQMSGVWETKEGSSVVPILCIRYGAILVVILSQANHMTEIKNAWNMEKRAAQTDLQAP